MCVGDLIEGESEMRAVERWGWGFFGIDMGFGYWVGQAWRVILIWP